MIFLLFLMLGAALGLGFRIGALAFFSVLAFAAVIIASTSGEVRLLLVLIEAALVVASLQAGYLLSIFCEVSRGKPSATVPHGWIDRP